ncbi:MAG: hypothetical protein RJA07_2255 [Bacteroidota bacterium]|jgi:hypothetical protein
MKKVLLFSFFVASLMASISANAQTIFSENFDGLTAPGLPANWTQWNGDGLTVNTGLSSYNFGTNAWVSRTFTGSTDGYMFSTSWYSAAGTSNDWLISPAITGVVSNSWLLFDAVALDANFPDGFQVKISTTGNNPATDFTSAAVLTVAAENGTWTTHAIDLSAYAGSTIHIAIINNSNDKFLLGLNNFIIKVLPSDDLNFQAMTPGTSDYLSYALVNGSVNVFGQVRNQGSNTVTSFNLKIDDGISVATFPQTPSIAPYQTAIINAQYTMPSIGMHPVKVWVELLNDVDNSNDTLKSEFGGASFTPTHHIVFEEGTGTWCGWCPRGAVFMDSVHKANKNEVYIAVHNSNTDPMQIPNYDNGITSLPGFGGFPSVVIDRAEVIDPSQMFTGFTNHIADFGVADLSLTATLSGNTITAHASANFAIDANANHDYRLAFVVTEDRVFHPGDTAYAQHNYYSSASQNQPLVGAGLNWQTEPVYVSTHKFHFDYVARSIDGNNFGGTPSSLPSTITHGATYNHTFTYTIPAGMDSTKIRLALLLVSNKSKQAQNARVVDWVKAVKTGMSGVIANNEFTMSIYPNPVVSSLNLVVDMNVTDNVSYTITNILGQTLGQENLGVLSNGSTTNHSVNVANLPSGNYILTVKTSKGVYTNKFIKE